MKLLLRLVSLCLVTRSGMTSADGNGSGVPTVAVEEGSDVILPCSISTKENIENVVFDWKKSDHKEVFFYDKGKHDNNGRGGQSEQFRGRVFHFQDELKNGNASVKVRQTNMADSGRYSCTFPNKQVSLVTLVVAADPERYVLKDRRDIPGAAPKPSVTILDQTKDSALLQCEVRGASPEPKVEWKDSDGNTLPAKEPEVTEREGRYDIILQTNVNKTNNYSCVVTQEMIYHQISTNIFVHIGGAAPEPSVTILDETKDWSLLQCEVRGASPEPKVEWKDSDGNTLPAKEPEVTGREGRYDIILQTTVTKTDNYRCVVTQETIHHQISAETFVHISGSNAGWIIAIVAIDVVSVLSTLLVVGVLLAVLVYKGCITLNRCTSKVKKQRPSGEPRSGSLLNASLP